MTRETTTERRTHVNRRTYLQALGATGTTAVAVTAGCLGGSGGGGGTETVVPGTAPGFPPFEMKEGGDLVGFDIDLLGAVVENVEAYELGEWKEFEFKSLVPALQNDKIDVIAAAMTITDKREKTVDFSDPYYSADQAILVREDGDFGPTRLSDLAGHPVGAQKGTTGEGVVQEQLIKPGKLKEQNYNSYGSYVLAVEDLVAGNIDAVVVDTPVAKTFAADRPVKIAFVYQTGEHYGFAVREADNQLVGAINDGLEEVRRAGTYEDLTSKWFGQG